MATELGVKGRTAEAPGSRRLAPAAVNSIGVVGLFARQFDDRITVAGERDLDWILGGAQADKAGRLIVDSLLANARGTYLDLHIVGWKASDAVQATATLQSGATTPADVLTLRDAYRGQDSSGRWANDTGYRVVHDTKDTKRVSGAVIAAQTEIPLNSVQGVSVADIVEITEGSNTYPAKVSAVNFGTRTITVAPAAALPALSDGATVALRAFRIVAYRRDAKGIEREVRTSLNSEFLSMEPDHPTDYVVTKFATHPLFRAIDAGAAATLMDLFPAATATTAYLTSGADGTAPSTVSDWTSLQTRFDQVRLFAVINTDSSSRDVHRAFKDWCETRDDFPQYFGAVPFVGSDWQLAEDFADPLLVPDGWNQLSLFYGYRFWPDPVDEGPFKARRISVHGAVMGAWLWIIYDGNANRALAENEFGLIGFVPGGEEPAEDAGEIESSPDGSATVRERLYAKGVNLVRQYRGGVRVRNFRSMTDDERHRDLHIHAINQIIKFSAEDDLKSRENVPLKRSELERIRRRIGLQVLKPMHEGRFFPYVVAADQRPGNGAFIDKDKNERVYDWHEVSQVISDASNNPAQTFEQGDAFASVQYATYSLMRKLIITVTPGLRLPGAGA